jgi:hypothetical protein
MPFSPILCACSYNITKQEVPGRGRDTQLATAYAFARRMTGHSVRTRLATSPFIKIDARRVLLCCCSCSLPSHCEVVAFLRHDAQSSVISLDWSANSQMIQSNCTNYEIMYVPYRCGGSVMILVRLIGMQAPASEQLIKITDPRSLLL